MSPLPFEERFDTYAGYRRALLELIQGATSEIVLFDPDLRETGLESSVGLETLTRFLGGGRQNRLRIVLHEPGYFERECARLRKLYQVYHHVMALRQAPDDLRYLTENFAVADKSRIVVRFHSDHPRGKSVIGEGADADGWRRRFDALWEASLETVPVGRLGL